MARLLAFALILGFSSYFTKDIVSLRKALLHPDFYTTYYPFRHWFTTRLAAGHFPLWNPNWGIGEAADVWATIPLDLYTPLELAFGPRYHLFHSFQALLFLAATLYGFTRLGFSPLLSAAVAILFFLTPHVTFFYFYFIVTHSYIAHVLLFTFVVLWFRTGRRRYLFLITWTTIFSMLGTKLEFWFFQTVYFVFLAFAGSFLFLRGRLYNTVRAASVPCAFMALGVVAHAWQLNILIRLMAESGRAVDSGIVNLISMSLYRNLALSLYESLFLKLALLAVLLLLALRSRGAKAYSLVALAAILCVFFLYQERLTFRPDPALKNGALESWARAGDYTLPEHFSFESDGHGDLRQVNTPGDVRSGLSALFITVPSTGEARLRYALADVSSYRGREVRLTVWSRSERPAPGSFKAVIDDGYSPPSTATLPSLDIWARTRLSHYVDAEARTLSITIAANSTAPAGVFIDDLSLERSSGFVRSKASRDGTMRGLFVTLLSSPVLIGALLGLALSLGLSGRSPWRDYATQSLLFFPLVYYYCRQAYGDLGEVYYVQLAPAALKIALGAGIWLGCGLLRRDPLAQLAYASTSFVFLMRDQGQIVLAYLTGWQWVPTRDNYILDFSFLLLALLGLAQLTARKSSFGDAHRSSIKGLAEGLALIAVAALLVATHSAPYYVHPLMAKAPPGYPYFTGVANVGDLFQRLRKDAPTSRALLDNEPFMEFHHGAGTSLVQGFSQVTSYASLNNARYREWTTYHHLGIRPEQHWRGYTNEYTPATVARLPRTNTLGYTNSQIYTYTLINRPPLDPNLLKLLDVGRVLHLYPGQGPYEIEDRPPPSVDDAIIHLQPTRLRAISVSGTPEGARPMFVADLPTPLPRAFVVPQIRAEQAREFESELSPTVEDGDIRTTSLRLPFRPATITRSEPEHVSIRVAGTEDATLVLTDLYHPFWHVTVDGRPTPMTPALFLFRAVIVPAGTHQVEFTCHIPNNYLMLALSILSALAAVVAFAPQASRRAGTASTTQVNVHGTGQ